MTSPLPPKRRDTRDSADLIRQLKQNARQLGVGMVGGRWSPAKPLGATAQMGDIEDDDQLDDDQPAAINTDVAYATVAGQIVLNLTYVPIEGTLLVFWDDGDLHPTEYVLAGQTVIFTDRHVHVGDRLVAAYWYWPSDVPEAVISFVGATSVHGGASSIPIHASAQPGDLLVLASATWARDDGTSGGVSTSDSRMVQSLAPHPGYLVAWGTATGSMTDVAVAVSPLVGLWASTTLAVYRGVAVDSHSTTFLSSAASISLPVMPAAYAALGVLLSLDGTVAGNISTDSTGAWHVAVTDSDSKAHSKVVDWDEVDSQDSPPGLFTTSGTPNGLCATTLRLVAT